MTELPWLGPDIMGAGDAKIIVGRAIGPFQEDTDAITLDAFNERISTEAAASAIADAVVRLWDRIVQEAADYYGVDLPSLDSTSA